MYGGPKHSVGVLTGASSSIVKAGNCGKVSCPLELRTMNRNNSESNPTHPKTKRGIYPIDNNVFLLLLSPRGTKGVCSLPGICSYPAAVATAALTVKITSVCALRTAPPIRGRSADISMQENDGECERCAHNAAFFVVNLRSIHSIFIPVQYVVLFFTTVSRQYVECAEESLHLFFVYLTKQNQLFTA